jgi:Zn-dependent M28 family amino/carboxypeptidase
LTVLLVSIALGQNRKPKFATLEELTDELKTVPCRDSKRFEAVKEIFESMGAGEADISTFKSGDIKDLIVTKKGKTGETVIIGAHYDKVEQGCGAIDNWTGIVTIANLYRSFRNQGTEKTYLFVAFDQEERGLIGSHAMAKSIPKDQISNYCWMVNIDSLGMTNIQVLDNVTTPKMREETIAAAKELNVPVGHGRFNASADSASFANGGIPAITFHGLDQNWPRYLHTPNDTFKNIKIPLVLDGYNFVFRYLTRIDERPCSEFRK